MVPYQGEFSFCRIGERPFAADGDDEKAFVGAASVRKNVHFAGDMFRIPGAGDVDRCCRLAQQFLLCCYCQRGVAAVRVIA